MSDSLKTVKFTKSIQAGLSKNFDCGNPALTLFLKNHIALDISYGTTYVMMADNTIVGYYNISTGCIVTEDNIRMGGSVYINCLAVDIKYQKKKFMGNYYSDILLADCLNHDINLREEIGFGFITLSSTEEGDYLYERNGFFQLEEDMSIAKNQGEDKCSPMYLPLDYE
ncbi:MAG: N-acetyltransferase [Ruminococcus sp.]|nr:N-acetyltransferase [Ruminococcus sp.]